MKNIFLTLIAIITISCKAQTVPLNTHYDDTNIGAYFKDTFNEMNKFEGTWEYSNGTDTLKIIIKKKTHYFDGEYYQDLLIGEYQFINNGQEIVNTIPNNSFDWSNIDERNIGGWRFITNNEVLLCSNCSQNEKRIKLFFSDPERNYLSLSLVLRYLPQSIGEPEKMTATLISNSGVVLPDANSPTEARVPYGEYLMIKQ